MVGALFTVRVLGLLVILELICTLILLPLCGTAGFLVSLASAVVLQIGYLAGVLIRGRVEDWKALRASVVGR